MVAVKLEVQISGQAQHFVNLHVQITWQAQHFVSRAVLVSRFFGENATGHLILASKQQHFVL